MRRASKKGALSVFVGAPRERVVNIVSDIGIQKDFFIRLALFLDFSYLVIADTKKDRNAYSRKNAVFSLFRRKCQVVS